MSYINRFMVDTERLIYGASVNLQLIAKFCINDMKMLFKIISLEKHFAHITKFFLCHESLSSNIYILCARLDTMDRENKEKGQLKERENVSRSMNAYSVIASICSMSSY